MAVCGRVPDLSQYVTNVFLFHAYFNSKSFQ